MTAYVCVCSAKSRLQSAMEEQREVFRTISWRSLNLFIFNLLFFFTEISKWKGRRPDATEVHEIKVSIGV